MTEDIVRTQRVEIAGLGGFRIEVENLTLRVVEGPDAPLQETFDLPLVRVGTDSANDLVLADSTVSRFHAQVRMEGEGARIRDLGSTNGIVVGGVAVTEGRLKSGARVQLGDTTLEAVFGNTILESVVEELEGLGPLVGSSPPMRDLYGLIRTVAPASVPVLLHGETGTGKELVARSLHEHSGLDGPLVVFDAASTSEELIRAELFGHLEGAFTGAVSSRLGAFRSADGGTLFLDELAELPLELQKNLLRVLESREVQPLGSDARHPVRVRFVAATHRDLEEKVRAGEFREDLYYRLAGVRIDIPPLRERPEDLPTLIEHLSRDLLEPPRFSAGALEAMRRHRWPGNVRELRNVVERTAVLCRGREVDPEDLDLVGEGKSARVPEPSGVSMADFERTAIERALARHDGHREAAARELGISPATLYRRLKQFRDEDEAEGTSPPE